MPESWGARPRKAPDPSIAEKVISEGATAKPAEGPEKKITVRLSADLHRRVKVRSANTGMPINDAVGWFLEEWAAGRVVPDSKPD